MARAARISQGTGQRRPTFEQLEYRALLSVTASEQSFIYFLNRARHDPVAYQNQAGISVDLSYVTARPPLAINDKLFASAEVHVDDMKAHNYFGHYSPYLQKWPNRLVRDEGYALPSMVQIAPNTFVPINDNSNQVESLAYSSSGTYTASASLKDLIVDQGVSPPGHREHLFGIGVFNSLAREIGVGNTSGTNGSYWAIHATLASTTTSFVTGVAFNDVDKDQLYDEGEGIAGITITAGNLATITNAAGGWSLAVPDGQYLVQASGGVFSTPSAVPVTVSGQNVEADFIAGLSTGYVDFSRINPVPPYQNPVDRLDVSRDGRISPTDLLIVVNEILANGVHELSAPAVPPRYFFDVNGDNTVSATDLVFIINDLLVNGSHAAADAIAQSQIAGPQSAVETPFELRGPAMGPGFDSGRWQPVSLGELEGCPEHVAEDSLASESSLPTDIELSLRSVVHRKGTKRSAGQNTSL